MDDFLIVHKRRRSRSFDDHAGDVWKIRNFFEQRDRSRLHGRTFSDRRQKFRSWLVERGSRSCPGFSAVLMELGTFIIINNVFSPIHSGRLNKSS